MAILKRRLERPGVLGRSLSFVGFLFALAMAPAAFAQGKGTYDLIRSFALDGDAATVEELPFKRDRVEMTFTGTFYFATPVDGKCSGAVFVGRGMVRAAVPPSEFEKDNVRRLLQSDVVESDFKTAVLRFSDDTYDEIRRKSDRGGPVTEQARKLGSALDARIMEETGANLPARLAVSVLNGENPGFFFAEFDGGKRNRFCVVIDHQNRIPVSAFDINAGEKGLFFAYQSVRFGNDVWMAFHSLQDYERRVSTYSDANDLVDITSYRMNVDLTDAKNVLRVEAEVTMKARLAGIRAVPFVIGESLGEFADARLKRQLRLKSARVGDVPIAAAQEGWEAGLTVFLPEPTQVGQTVTIAFDLEGDFMRDEPRSGCAYPRSNTTWYPRHGYLDRSTYELTFRHRKRLRVASVGTRVSEEVDAAGHDVMVTKYRMDQPIALVTFALGPFERHSQMVKWDKGGDPIPVEFNSLPGSLGAIKEDFILAELDNSVRYFAALFGAYPYPTFGAAYHPYGFGQGFPTLLMIPATDRASKYTYAFVSHETAHQWWGNIVAWRSYRDQWLSEGFAEYSGVLYTGLRASPGARDDLIRSLRSSLLEPPRTTTGIGSGRLAEIGPLVLGHRLNSSKSFGAYQALIYDKGALVLRMLHFLMTNPLDGDDRAFFEMMTDFVRRYRGQSASSDDFRVVANEHFARTPLSRKYKLNNLDWFFDQWVAGTALPSYELEYQITSDPDGSAVVSGTVIQINAPETWFMPLPVVVHLEGKKEARGTVHAHGPKTAFEIRLPMRPTKVELDPSNWVLSQKTSTRAR
jgi:hypothetical protein